MRNKQIMTWTLLSAIALLLAMSLLRKESYAHDWSDEAPPIKLVGIAVFEVNGAPTLYRAWDNGVVEENRDNYPQCSGWCGWEVIPEK